MAPEDTPAPLLQEPQPGSSYLSNPPLAILLSKLAALQGHAIAAYRFGMVEKTPDGIDLASLAPDQQAVELWCSQFSAATHQRMSLQELTRDVYPVLWVGSTQQQALVVRGKLAAGVFNCEDHLGLAKDMTPNDLAAGHFLQLQPGFTAQAVTSNGLRSAGDWFVYSVRQYRSVFVDAVVATFLVSALGLAGAMYSMQVYDRVLPSKGYETLLVLTVGALLAILLEFVLKQLRSQMIDRACKVIDQDLSAVFFGKALSIRMDARPKTVGTFASQIRYFESVRHFLTSSTLFVLADMPFAVFFLGVIAMISPWVALVPLVFLPLSLLLAWMLRKPIGEAAEMNMVESNRKNGLLIEAIDGVESIKSSAAEWKVLERWRKLTATIAAGELRMKLLTNFSTNASQMFQQLTYVGMVMVGAYEIVNGHLTMGGLIACTIISGRALGPLNQIPNLVVQWKHAQMALKNLDGIMALPDDRDTTVRQIVPQQCTGEISLDQVGFAYTEGQLSLQIQQWQLKPGERVGVVGAVGSGKSTLVKVLSGLYKPQQGEVFLDHTEINHLAPEFVREHIGYLPQDVRLFQGTLRENLTLGLPSPSDSQILHAAQMTGLDRVIRAHPKGLELDISEGGKGLSGGQRQLVGLTRLLLQQPRVMLLDEPTASMDSQLETLVMRHLFQEISPQSALLVVTHKPAVLAHVSRLVVMDAGRIVLDGPKDQVLAKLRH